MSTLKPVRFLALAGILSVAGFLAVGCGKKETEIPVPPPTAEQPGTETAPVAPPPVAAPTAAQNAWADARLKEAQAAQQARDYGKAVEQLIAVQQAQQRLSEAQAAAAANQMRQFQRDLAGAVASGDPRAKAAADRLRASSIAR
jgi:hypothetical protein